MDLIVTCSRWATFRAPPFGHNAGKFSLMRLGALGWRRQMSSGGAHRAALGDQVVEKAFDAQDGRQCHLKFQAGKIAPLAEGAVLGWMDETCILATACKDKFSSGSGDFLPLSVEYREKSAAAGQIPDHMLRRELGPKEHDIVTARLIDRAVRPLFPASYMDSTQIICTKLAHDGVGDSQVVALNGTSLALMMAKTIPWKGPVGCVRVSCREVSPGQYEYFTFPKHMDANELDSNNLLSLLVAGTRTEIVMIDMASYVPLAPERICEALRFACGQLNQVIDAQEEFLSVVGASAKNLGDEDDRAAEELKKNEELYQQTLKALETSSGDYTNLVDGIRSNLVDQLLKAGASHMIVGESDTQGDDGGEEDEAMDVDSGSDEDDKEQDSEEDFALKAASAGKAADEIMRSAIKQQMRNGIRSDGRRLDQIRPVQCTMNVLPVVHGSASFARGKTSVLGSVTLGTLRDSMKVMPYCGDHFLKRFMLHYDFPPFSVNETGRVGLNRRMIGHGDLAEKALLPVIPSADAFQYAIRLNADTMSSDGSSSMATVCAGTLALLNAGVKLKEPVAGISMGLIRGNYDEEVEDGKKYDDLLLTDITMFEDNLGDMDCKVAGTRSGITAIQMDVKSSVKLATVEKAIARGHVALQSILDEMAPQIADDGGEVNDSIPRVEVLRFEGPKTVRKLIGSGGSMVRKLESDYDVKLEIMPDDEDNYVRVYAKDRAGMDRIKKKIEAILWSPSVGHVLEGAKVSKILHSGIQFEINDDGAEGFMHISEVAIERVDRLDTMFKEGQPLPFPIKCISASEGPRPSYSRRALLMEERADLAKTIKLGTVFDRALVVRIRGNLTVVRLPSGVEGLIFARELSDKRNVRPEDILRIGQYVRVKCIEEVSQSGKSPLFSLRMDAQPSVPKVDRNNNNNNNNNTTTTTTNNNNKQRRSRRNDNDNSNNDNVVGITSATEAAIDDAIFKDNAEEKRLGLRTDNSDDVIPDIQPKPNRRYYDAFVEAFDDEFIQIGFRRKENGFKGVVRKASFEHAHMKIPEVGDSIPPVISKRPSDIGGRFVFVLDSTSERNNNDEEKEQ